MLKLKLVPVNLVLLLLLVTFTLAFLANTVFAVDIPLETGSSQISDIVNNVLSSPAVENIINTTKVEVTAERITAKPLLNELTPQEEMISIDKETIRSEEKNIVKSALSSQLPPQF